MKQKFLAFSSPIGLFIFIIYAISSRLINNYSDTVAYILMFSSVVFMLIGTVYNGYCMGKKRNPYDFK